MTGSSGDQIAFFLPDLIGAGAQRVMLNLAKGVAARGYAVDMVLAKAHGSYMGEVPDTIRIVDLGAPRLIASVPALTRYMRKERPRAILSGLANANIVALWAKKMAGISSRLVVTEHNTLSVDTQNALNWRARQIPRLIKHFYHWADGIVAVSHGVADDLAQSTSIPRQKIQAIYNPVILPDMAVKAAASVEHPWFGAGKPPVLLGVGRLTMQKNFPLLIQAFAKVRQNRPVRLLILGEGEDRPQLEELVRTLGIQEDVCLPGFADNPYAYMANAGLFVLSSSWEGLPTVLIEAIYCGAPVVATDCPSGPQEILASGQYGALTPVNDVDALSHTIEAALDGKTPRPSPQSWQPFEIETVVSQYLAALLNEN
ncbi:MAG: glycosyltransferase [Caldilineaceae bacterium]|nr:glycosyltransferase [Caldilineaceae bacterium]